MVINVTQDHIDRGNSYHYNPFCCPIARAITDVLKTINADLYVGVSDTISVYNDNKLDLHGGYSGPTPELVHDWIDRFDSGLDVQPFSFELPIDHLLTRTPQ